MRHLEILEAIRDVARAGSIRKAASDRNITASALNRQILRFEAEFGSPVFERLAQGVRLNPAGELLLAHHSQTLADLARLREIVAGLEGLRTGTVAIAASQALMPYFLPRQIAAFRARHPGVCFTVRGRDRIGAERDLATFASDLALVFEPVHLVDFEVLATCPQPVRAVMAVDHPLAARGRLRLRDCFAWPHVVPREPLGVRQLLDRATRAASRRLAPALEADSFEFMRHYVREERAVSFQIAVGLPQTPGDGIAILEIDPRDLPEGRLFLGRLRGRTLPVASERFAAQLAAAMADL